MPEQHLSVDKPLPQPDELSRPFFDGARQHRLMIQRCRDCKTYQLPGRLICDECLSESLEWVEASGRATVFSFVIMHQRYHPAFARDVPYNVAMVELEEGPRLITSIAGASNEEIAVGMPVSATFERVTEDITLPKFRSE